MPNPEYTNTDETISISDTENTNDTLSINSDEYEICNEIEDYEYEYTECVDNQYYIGSCYLMKDIDQDVLLFGLKININTFYDFSNDQLSTYMYFCSGLPYTKKPTIEIMKLSIHPDGTYNAILKTFWIKIIQRKWKKIMKQKKEYENNIKKNILSIFRTVQLTGRMLQPPGLRCML
jgi:hypothetical protein